MPYRKFGENLHKLSDKIVEYGEFKLDYYKLVLYKSVIKMARSLFIFLLFGAVLLLSFIFISFGLSYLIGEAVGNIAYGFLIMGGFYVVMLILLATFGKKIIEKQVFTMTSEWFSDETEKNI